MNHKNNIGADLRRLMWVLLCCCWLPAKAEISQLPKPDACVFAGEFLQTKQLAGLPSPVESTGSFYRDCEQGLIWKTVRPVAEALIITDEKKVFLTRADKVKRVSSRAGKMISRLMLSLLSDDQELMRRHFDVQIKNEHPHKVLLIPKTRRFKRGLKSLTLFSAVGETKALSELPQLRAIEIRDQQDQLTLIQITEQNKLEPPGSSDACLAVSLMAELECHQLYDQSKDVMGAPS